MRVALNVSALRSPKTGIGRYVGVLKAGLAASNSGVYPDYFWGDHWTRGNGAPDKWSTKRSYLRRKFGNLFPFAHELHRCRQQQDFNGGCQTAQLYHEPNFLPFSFAGPTVLTVHDLSVLRYPEMHPRGRVRLFERYFEKGLRNAAHVITDTATVRQEVAETFGLSLQHITAIPLAADVAFSPRARSEVDILQRYNLHPRGYWMTLATLEPRKNLQLVLEAFRALPQTDRRTGGPLVVVGMQGWKEGSLLAQMEPFIQSGEIRFLGYVADADLPALVAGASALLYPSRYEGFGLPPLEAMACGTPVIASTADSVAEVVADAGVLVNPDDVESCVQAMRCILHDEAYSAGLSLRGLQRSKDFSWEKCVTKTISVYRDVLLEGQNK